MMENSYVVENVEEANIISGKTKIPDIITIEDDTIEDDGLQDTPPRAKKKEHTKNAMGRNIIKKSKGKKTN